MGPWPERTASLICSCWSSEPAEGTMKSSPPPGASRRSSANRTMFRVWIVASP